MFGHGQLEGYAEKYGMEFRRPRWEEQPDQWERLAEVIAERDPQRIAVNRSETFALADGMTDTDRSVCQLIIDREQKVRHTAQVMNN